MVHTLIDRGARRPASRRRRKRRDARGTGRGRPRQEGINSLRYHPTTIGSSGSAAKAASVGSTHGAGCAVTVTLPVPSARTDASRLVTGGARAGTRLLEEASGLTGSAAGTNGAAGDCGARAGGSARLSAAPVASVSLAGVAEAPPPVPALPPVPAPCAGPSPSSTVMTTWLEVIGGMPSAWTVAVLGKSSRQVLKLPITKSDSVAVGLCDERVSARKLEKQPPSPRAVRSTPSSRNSPAAGPVLWLLSVKDQGTEMDPEFTIANVVVPGAATCTRLPVASSPVQRKTVIVEVEPPMVKSLTSRMSPSLWVPVNGLPLDEGLVVLGPTAFWKNQ